MNIYRIKLQWQQAIRDMIAQDESRLVGYRLVVSTVVVIAATEQLAVNAVLDSMQHHQPTIITVTHEPIHLIIDYNKRSCLMISPDEVIWSGESGMNDRAIDFIRSLLQGRRDELSNQLTLDCWDEIVAADIIHEHEQDQWTQWRLANAKTSKQDTDLRHRDNRPVDVADRIPTHTQHRS